MKDVQQWENVAAWIGIPRNKRHELKSQNPTTGQAKQACWDYWLHHHPAPSWRILAGGLYEWRVHGALEVLQMNYLKGECACATYMCPQRIFIDFCIHIHVLLQQIWTPSLLFHYISKYLDPPAMHVINYSIQRGQGYTHRVN